MHRHRGIDNLYIEVICFLKRTILSYNYLTQGMLSTTSDLRTCSFNSQHVISKLFVVPLLQDEGTILLLISRGPLENLKHSFRCKNASFRICLRKANISKVVRKSEHLIKEDHRLVRKYMAINQRIHKDFKSKHRWYMM